MVLRFPLLIFVDETDIYEMFCDEYVLGLILLLERQKFCVVLAAKVEHTFYQPVIRLEVIFMKVKCI
jgi:hypothetical protein